MRDMALRRLLRAKRWILAGSLALTGALAGIAANAFPGKTIKPSASSAGAEAGTAESSSSAETSSEGAAAAVTPPEQAPQSSEAESPSGEQAAEEPVVSGGS